MKSVNLLLFLQFLSLPTLAATYGDFSPFLQDWKLTSGQGCAAALSGYIDTDVPGVGGIPRSALNTQSALRISDPSQIPISEIFTLGTHPSSVTEGDTRVTLSGQTLTATDQELQGVFRRKLVTLRMDRYALTSDLGLVVSTQSGEAEPHVCVYANAQPEKLNREQVGAVLISHGVKVAECRFTDASPTANQRLFQYNQKCSFGKFLMKTLISSTTQVLGVEVVANPKAIRNFEILRSSAALNTESEIWISRDTEIAVKDSDVDDIKTNTDEYFASPYRANQFSVYGTDAIVQFVYAAKTPN